MKKLIWMGCLSYLVIGIAHVIGGAVLEQLMEHYGITYKDGGQWIMNQFLGFLAGVLIAPYLTSRMGKRGAVLLALGMLTLSEAAYSLLPPWEWMLAVAPLAGFGFGMTEAVVGAIIIDLIKEKKASAMSRLETFFGLGALLIPAAAALLIQQHVWQLSFPILAAMSGIAFVLWLTLSFGSLDNELGIHPGGSPGGAEADGPVQSETVIGSRGYSAKAMPFLILSALFFMVYVGLEMSFSNYLPSIMSERAGMGEAGSAATLSVFWGMMVFGRMFAGVLADRAGYGKYLLVAAVGAAIVFGLLGLSEGGGWMLVLIGLGGLFFSGIFGIALVYANSLLPGMTERTTSLLVAAGGIGGALLPRLTGWFMDQTAAGPTLWFFAALAAVILLLLAAMLAAGRRQTEPEPA